MYLVIEIRVRTARKIEARSITSEIAAALRDEEGEVIHVFTPHTTCGLLINEDADPAVMRDVLAGLNRLVPDNLPYEHGEGNSDAHIKSSLVGHSLLVPLSGGRLALGTWQGIFLMEFDGPRERKVQVRVLK